MSLEGVGVELNVERVREDFDRIARITSTDHYGDDRYDAFLVSLVPAHARTVLDVGCGTGRLAARIADQGRDVLGVDLSPEMIARAEMQQNSDRHLRFQCGDFLEMELAHESFDCVISAAALHHMPLERSVTRMIELLRPGGTLVLQDLRAAANVLELGSFFVAGAVNAMRRWQRTGRFLQDRAVRKLWAEHGAHDHYLTMPQVHALVNEHLAAAAVYRHWFWKYTVVWKKPSPA
jgi:2-polyprenyl-3-methyl-5-hydroxy-6-metoxy-1,4-benzoquinol methylase